MITPGHLSEEFVWGWCSVVFRFQCLISIVVDDFFLFLSIRFPKLIRYLLKIFILLGFSTTDFFKKKHLLQVIEKLQITKYTFYVSRNYSHFILVQYFFTPISINMSLCLVFLSFLLFYRSFQTETEFFYDFSVGIFFILFWITFKCCISLSN